MKNMGLAGLVIGLLGVVGILLIDVIMGRPYSIGRESIIGLVVCAVLILFGLFNLKRAPQA
jgi:hypothetical protein